jgi:hypothetical protein
MRFFINYYFDFVFILLNKYSHLSGFAGDWFQDLPEIQKSMDVQVPYIR